MRTTICTLFMLSLLAGFASCSSDDFTDGPLASGVADSESLIQHITVTLPSIEDEDGTADTRSTFTNVDSGNFNAVWSEGDTLGIFPSSGGQVEFAIKSFGTNSANFDGGGWGLKNAETYAAYYPFSKQNVYATNKTIPLDYTGQVQRGNGSHSHLGAKDYLASAAVKRSGDGLNFSMLRQGALVGLTLTVPATDTYTEIELVTDGTPFVTKANLDISSTSAPSVSAVERSNVLRLKLEDVTVSANGTLKAYMMIFPDGTVTPRVILHGKKGTYEGVVPKQMALTRNKNYARTITSFTGVKIKNLYLIAAAENFNGVSFTKDTSTGYVDLGNADNLALLDKVINIDVSGKNDPTVLDEIGYFKNVELLTCGNNNLTSMDVSNLKSLKILTCENNKLTSLNVSSLRALSMLNCANNQLTSLDLSANKVLTILICNKNKLKTLDVSNLLLLEGLDCSNNQLTTLKLPDTPTLTTMNCNINRLTSLDVSKNTGLSDLSCIGNLLTSLDVSMNTKLEKLSCASNKLTSLNVTKNTALTGLNCQYNQLSSLNVSKNTNLVDLQCSSNKINSLNVENNTALQKLYCNDNRIVTLNIDNNIGLTHLNCGNNLIEEFIISVRDYRVGHANLEYLNISNSNNLKTLRIVGGSTGESYNVSIQSKLTRLIVSGCTALETLVCTYTPITSLDISSCTALKTLHCYLNSLTSLDVSNNTTLTSLVCWGNGIGELDITNCSSLKLSEVFCGHQNYPEKMTLYETAAQHAESSLDLTRLCFNSNQGNTETQNSGVIEVIK